MYPEIDFHAISRQSRDETSRPYCEYLSRGSTKSDHATKENRDFGEDPPVHFHENHPCSCHSWKWRKCRSVFYQGNYQTLPCIMMWLIPLLMLCAPNIGELEPTMEPTEDSEPNQVPQESSSHPDLVEVPENQNSSCDLESPMKELPDKEKSCPPISKTLSLRWWPKQDLLLLFTFPGRRKGKQD